MLEPSSNQPVVSEVGNGSGLQQDSKSQIQYYIALSTFSHTLLHNRLIDPSTLFHFALNMVLEFTLASSGRMLLLDRGGRVRTSMTLPDGQSEELEEHCLEAIENQRPAVRNFAGREVAEGQASQICIPLVGKNQCFGVLCLCRNSGEPPFDAKNLDLASAFADQIAYSLYAERLLKEKFETEHLATLGRMASRIVHDLNNPLNVVMGYTDMMLKRQYDQDRQRELLGKVLSQAENMSTMLKEVLAYAGSRRKLNLKPMDVSRQVEGIVHNLKIALQEKTAQVELLFESDGEHLIQGENLALGRAFRNLLVNAIEAVEPVGKVSVRVFRPDDRDVAIEISDDGPGIPEEIRESLFQPFITHGKEQGTGLGLSISKNIFEEHGGALDFKTSSSGTTFLIRLPAA